MKRKGLGRKRFGLTLPPAWSVWEKIQNTSHGKKVKCSRYRPGVAQRVGKGIALLFHDRGIRRGWVVSSTPRPHFTPGKDPVPILKEAGWAPGPVWTGGKSRPHPDRPARNQSLYRLSYLAHTSHGRRIEILKRHFLKTKQECHPPKRDARYAALKVSKFCTVPTGD